MLLFDRFNVTRLVAKQDKPRGIFTIWLDDKSSFCSEDPFLGSMSSSSESESSISSPCWVPHSWLWWNIFNGWGCLAPVSAPPLSLGILKALASNVPFTWLWRIELYRELLGKNCHWKAECRKSLDALSARRNFKIHFEQKWNKSSTYHAWIRFFGGVIFTKKCFNSATTNFA